MCMETIKEIICPELKPLVEELNEVKATNKDLAAALSGTELKLEACANGCEVISERLKRYETEEASEANLKFRVDVINHAYPFADVYYLGRKMPTKINSYECDVKLFITPTDARIIEFVKNNKLKVADPWACNADLVKIYKACRQGSTYLTDSQNFSSGEVWLFPFEFMALSKQGDCEDNAHFIASTMIAAGVPECRVRVVCGMCALGGHSTIYVLGDDLATWYHLNSTGGHDNLTELTKFPTSKDTSTDQLGISSVWFSFNNLFAWHTFKTSTAIESFAEEASKKFRIVPRAR